MAWAGACLGLLVIGATAAGAVSPVPNPLEPEVEATILAGNEGWVSAIAYSPDGQRLVTGSYDGSARVWDLASGRELLQLRAPHLQKPHGYVMCVAISRDGRRIASGGGAMAVLWDSATGELLKTFDAGDRTIDSCAISPDGRQLAVGYADARVRLWDLSEVR
jgi:WD40 repeat protein